MVQSDGWQGVDHNDIVPGIAGLFDTVDAVDYAANSRRAHPALAVSGGVCRVPAGHSPRELRAGILSARLSRDLGAESFRGASSCFGGLFLAILGRGGGFEGAQQARRNAGDFIDCGEE